MFVSILKTRADREDAAQSLPRIAETIFTLYGNAMFRAAYDVLREDWAAEDAVMDALEHICVHEEEFVSLPERNARRLALRVVRNAALDRWRRRNRRAEHELPAGKASPAAGRPCACGTETASPTGKSPGCSRSRKAPSPPALPAPGNC